MTVLLACSVSYIWYKFFFIFLVLLWILFISVHSGLCVWWSIWTMYSLYRLVIWGSLWHRWRLRGLHRLHGTIWLLRWSYGTFRLTVTTLLKYRLCCYTKGGCTNIKKTVSYRYYVSTIVEKNFWTCKEILDFYFCVCQYMALGYLK